MGSRKKKKRTSSRRPVTPNTKRRLPLFKVALMVVGVAVAAGLLLYSVRQSRPDRATLSSSGDSKGPEARSSEKAGNFRNLVGRWLRPDGGYVMEIRSVDSGGRMDAAYFNPRPIHVSRAEASWKKGVQQVFIELRDTGYPGSTYTLIYNRQQDMLIGTYFQAAIGQNFEVVFGRAK